MMPNYPNVLSANNMKKIICKRCKKVFFRENWRKQTFCSLSCAGKHNFKKKKLHTKKIRNKISATITYLHKNTELWKNYDKKSYDSRRGNKHYKWKGKTKTYNCKYCGKKVTLPIYNIRHSFCNMKCKNKFWKERYPDELRKLQRLKKIEYVEKCYNTGKPISPTIGKNESEKLN